MCMKIGAVCVENSFSAWRVGRCCAGGDGLWFVAAGVLGMECRLPQVRGGG